MAPSLQSYTVLESAVRTADTTSDPQFNRYNTGCHVIVDIPALAQITTVTNSGSDAAGGTFTVTVDGDETAAIDFDADDAAIEAAIELASGLDVTVTGDVDEFVILFQDVAVHVVTADGTLLTGAGAPYTFTPVDSSSNGTATVSIQGQDPASGEWYTILTSAAIATAVTTVLKVHPGITVAANLSVADFLPAKWRVFVDHGGDALAALVYTVGVNLI